MLLSLAEIPQRLTVNVSRNIKAGGQIMAFGENNDYPDVMERLVLGSASGSSALNMYTRFLAGNGFAKEGVNSIVVGRDSKGVDITALDVLKAAAYSVALNRGYYQRLTYEAVNSAADMHITDIRPLQFRTCKFSPEDETGFSAFIYYLPDWSGVKSVNRKSKAVKYHVFSDKQNVIRAQLIGNENFKGQIKHCFFDKQYFYPLNTFDSVYLDCDTERCMAEYRNNEIRNGFADTVLIGTAPHETPEAGAAFHKKLTKQLGTRADKIFPYTMERDDDDDVDKNSALKVDTIPTNINDKLFSSWVADVKTAIYTAASNIPSILAESQNSTKFGTTSGEAFNSAVRIYNDLTKEYRVKLGAELGATFVNHKDPVLRSNTDWSVTPLNPVDVEPKQ